jgi:hypothetical protein
MKSTTITVSAAVAGFVLTLALTLWRREPSSPAVLPSPAPAAVAAAAAQPPRKLPPWVVASPARVAVAPADAAAATAAEPPAGADSEPAPGALDANASVRELRDPRAGHSARYR